MLKEEKILEIVKKLETLASELKNSFVEKDGNSNQESINIRNVDLEIIRACLAELLHDGKREQIVELLAKYGAKCLSDVPEEHYPALLKEAEEMKNA